MQTTQGTMLLSLRAVQKFLDDNADRLAGVVQTGARQRLDAAIKALDGHASNQNAGTTTSRGLTQKQRALRISLLRDHMSSIARIAKADLPNTLEFHALRMPAGKPTPERLAAAASGMAQVAAGFSDVFVSAGLPKDFIAQLNSATEAMVNALVDRQTTRGRVRGATTGLKNMLSEGRRIVSILDAFVKTALKDDRVLLDDWNSVKRIPKATGGAAAAPGTSSSVSTPAPDPVQAPTG